MASGDVLTFGIYRLIPAQRLLSRDDEAVEIGSRALDILIALAEAAGEVVGQRDLMARTWLNLVVGEGSLRVTIADLRKVLADGQNGTRYIANVTGRGYCLVAPVHRAAARSPEPLPRQSPPAAKHGLPVRLARVVGSDSTVEALSRLLISRRFLSIVGAGSMGNLVLHPIPGIAARILRQKYWS